MTKKTSKAQRIFEEAYRRTCLELETWPEDEPFTWPGLRFGNSADYKDLSQRTVKEIMVECEKRLDADDLALGKRAIQVIRQTCEDWLKRNEKSQAKRKARKNLVEWGAPHRLSLPACDQAFLDWPSEAEWLERL